MAQPLGQKLREKARPERPERRQERGPGNKPGSKVLNRSFHGRQPTIEAWETPAISSMHFLFFLTPLSLVVHTALRRQMSGV